MQSMEMNESSRVTIKPLTKTRVVGLRETVANYAAQGMLWGRVMQFCGENNIAIDEATPIFAIFYDHGYKPQDVDMEVCVPINTDAEVPVDTKKFQVYWSEEFDRAASITHKGSYSRMRESYAALFDWIETNSEKPKAPAREIFQVSMANYDGKEDSLVTEIIVPIA